MAKQENQYSNLGLIVARGQNREIGYKNDLIWRIEEDMIFFKNITMNSYIIMGRNTYESIPKKLPGRKYIVLSRDEDFVLETPKIVHRSIDETIEFVFHEKNSTFWVIGGGIIYGIFLPYVQTMHITNIDDFYPNADTFFPVFNENDWYKKTDGNLQCPEKNIDYEHTLYLRKE